MIRTAIVLVVTLGYPAMVAAQESRTYVAGALMQSSQDSGYLVGGRRATHRCCRSGVGVVGELGRLERCSEGCSDGAL